MPATIMPGSRVKVFDPRLHKDDISTPSSFTWRPATVVCRYGSKSFDSESGLTRYYPDLIDVLFDHRPESVSRGHFTEWVESIEENQ